MMESESSNASSKKATNGVTAATASTVTEIEEETADSFPRFDVLSPGKEADHFYKSNKCGIKTVESAAAAGSGAASKAYKKIMQEWRVLEKDLPDSIYVRVYESRIDLMRAAIVGASGTPYHDGLFFFDIWFPPTYPAVPPKVCYKSFGARINPNLYADGKVCLSLLNTWTGSKKERWNPKESNILQLLISIQALILNEKPYFNEPGRSIARDYLEKKSAAYNGDVFILSCKTMLWLLRFKSMGFEDFIPAHFRDRARTVLAACHAYVSGEARVGCYGAAIAPARRNRAAAAPSERFKASMRELYPLLRSSFLGAGASVGDFVEQLQGDRAVPVRKKEGERGIAGRIFGKLWELLGLKKKTKEKKRSNDHGGRGGRKEDVFGRNQKEGRRTVKVKPSPAATTPKSKYTGDAN